MQTIIDTLLIVISNIPGIDETVYANIYDIEQTDKTVFVIVPGDIPENITAYLVNGSIQLMSKVMLVLKSKYMETNIVITSNDNIKEFSLDNCSGVYNIIKYKRIFKREYCGDSYEGMFVKSVNGLHGEVFLDIPQKISDLPNDVGYITEDELPDYTAKLSEIDSSIQDVSARVFYIEADYVKQGELPDYTDKFNEIDSSISNVSTRVNDIENDYVKHGDLPDYTDKFNQIDSSISNVSTRVNDIENDYVKHDELPIIHDYTDKFNEIDSSISNVSTRVNDIENDYVKHGDLPDYTVKLNEIDSSISNVSTRVHDIENDYVKHDELPILPDYTDKFNEIDSSISNVSTRVHDIENDYTTREYVDQKISEIVIESGVTSVNGLTGDVIIDIPSKVSDLQNDSNFISRQEAEDEFSKKGDVYTKGQIDQKFVQTAQGIVDVSTNVNNVSTNLNNEVNRLDQRITDVSSNIPSLTDYAKTIYVDQKVQDVSTFVSDNFAKKSDIPTDYVRESEYQIKIQEIESDISAFVDSSFVESENEKTLNSAKSYTDGQILLLETDVSSKISKLNVSINNEFNRIWDENYVKHDEIADFVTNSSVSDNYAKKSEITNFITSAEAAETYATNEKVNGLVTGVSSVNSMTGDVLIDIPTKVSDLQNDSDFISKQEAEDGFIKKGDVYTKGQIDQKFIQTAKRIIDVSTNLKNEVNRLDQIITNVSTDITTINSSLQSYNTRITDNELKNTDQDSSISILNTSVNTLNEKLGDINTILESI